MHGNMNIKNWYNHYILSTAAHGSYTGNPRFKPWSGYWSPIWILTFSHSLQETCGIVQWKRSRTFLY